MSIFLNRKLIANVTTTLNQHYLGYRAYSPVSPAGLSSVTLDSHSFRSFVKHILPHIVFLRRKKKYLYYI